MRLRRDKAGCARGPARLGQTAPGPAERFAVGVLVVPLVAHLRDDHVAGRITTGNELGPPPDGHLPHPPVQRVPADTGPPQMPVQTGHRPGPRPLEQHSDPRGQPPAAQPRPPAAGPVSQTGHPAGIEAADPAAHRGRVVLHQHGDLCR